MGPVLTLLIIVVLAMTIIRVGAIALVKTGLGSDTAWFQALSAFFGVGFTTSEAEHIVNHPVRRRIAIHLMIAGNIGLLSTIGTVFALVPDDEHAIPLWIRLVIVLSAVVIMLLLTRLRWFVTLIDWSISVALERAHAIEAFDYEQLLNLRAGYAVVEIDVIPGHFTIGHSLKVLGLKQRGTLILAIVRDNGDYVGVPSGETEIEEGDVLIIYGRRDDIRAAMERES